MSKASILMSVPEGYTPLQRIDAYRRSEIERDPDMLLDCEFVRDLTLHYAGAVGSEELQEDIRKNLIDGLLIELPYFSLLETIQPGILSDIALSLSLDRLHRELKDFKTDVDALHNDLQTIHDALKPLGDLAAYYDRLSARLNPTNILKGIRSYIAQKF